jgi:hypothetical protein
MVQGNRPRGSGEEGNYADGDAQHSTRGVAQYPYNFDPASTYLTGESSGFKVLNSIEEIDGTTIPHNIPLEFSAHIATFHAFHSASAPSSTLSAEYMPVWDVANPSLAQTMQTPEEDSVLRYQQAQECLQVNPTGHAASYPQLAIMGDHGGEANISSGLYNPLDLQPGLAETEMAPSLFDPVTLIPLDVSGQCRHPLDTNSQLSLYLVGDWPIVSTPGVCGTAEFNGPPPWTDTTQCDASSIVGRNSNYGDPSMDLQPSSSRSSGRSRSAGTAYGETVGGVSKTKTQRRNLQNPTFLLEVIRRNEAETKFGSLDCYTNDRIHVYEIGPTEAQASVSANVVREKAPDILCLWRKDRLYSQNDILSVVELFGRDDEEWPYFFKEVTMRRVARIFKNYYKATAKAMLSDSTSSSVVLSTEDSVWVCTVFPIIWEAWNNPRRTAIEGRVRLQKVRKVGEKVNMKDL